MQGIFKYLKLKSKTLKKSGERKYSVLQIIGKLGRFRTFFFYVLLEWLPTVINSKYIELFTIILPPLKIQKRS